MKNSVKTTLFALFSSNALDVVFVRWILNTLENVIAHTRLYWMRGNYPSRRIFYCNGFFSRVCYLIILIGHFSSPAFASGPSIIAEINKTQVGWNPYSRRRVDIICPDNTATRLPTNLAHPDAYVCCEDFNLYQRLMEQGRESEARALLLAPPGSAGRMADIAAAQRKKK